VVKGNCTVDPCKQWSSWLFIIFVTGICFLADRTVGRAIGTMCRLSSVCNVLYCGETVRPSEKVSEEVNRKPGSKSSFLGRRHISTSGFAATATETAAFALFLPVQPSNRYYMVEFDFVAANMYVLSDYVSI